jgi:hypothetical protein
VSVPHVVLEGSVDLRRYAEEFQPILIRRSGDILRADRVFVEREGRALLVEALVVEAGRKLSFYILVSGNDRGGATVRVDPMTHPERSDGVRDLVAHVGADLLARSPGARVKVTNLVLPSVSAGTRESRSRDEEERE